MAHIVILGAGIGGMPAAYELRAALDQTHRITVVNELDYFQFVPSNPWLAVGWREREAITFPIRPYLEKKDIQFVAQPVQRIDAAGNALALLDGSRLAYDYLLITTGPKLSFDEVPGAGPALHTQSICTVDHAQQTHAHYERFLKEPGPAIIGAMPGASCFGPAYEFAFIFSKDLQRRKLRHKVPLTFVTSEPYIGHLGLGGVGDSRGMIESAFRDKHIKWICNAKVTKIEAGKMFVTEVNEDGIEKKQHELPFKYSMMLPAFKGVDAVFGIEGLTNPRGFILIDEYQRNPKFQNVFSVGVCVAIPPVEATPVPTGTPKTGYMIESMVTAAAYNIRALLDDHEPDKKATWNAICLADFGDTGIAFAAMPQIPPRNVNWFSEGKWVHLAKVAFEKYFLMKMKNGTSEPFYEGLLLKTIGIKKLKD